jgi:hypothetical protein
MSPFGDIRSELSHTLRPDFGGSMVLRKKMGKKYTAA